MVKVESNSSTRLLVGQQERSPHLRAKGGVDRDGATQSAQSLGEQLTDFGQEKDLIAKTPVVLEAKNPGVVVSEEELGSGSDRHTKRTFGDGSYRLEYAHPEQSGIKFVTYNSKGDYHGPFSGI